jgi:PAS domain S-box-containing protein
MSRSNPVPWLKLAVVWGYGTAAFSITAAVIVAHWPVFHLQSAPVSLFLCAIIVSAWYGGAGPGLFATALSVPAFYYYVLPPIHSFAAKPEEMPRFVIYTVSALFVGSICAAQRKAAESLRRTHEELSETVRQLQSANQTLETESQERRQAEEALRSSEQQWRNAFENNPTMYFLLETSGSIRSVNPFGATQLGYTVEELVGRSVWDLFHEADREAVQQYSASCLEKLGESLSWELRKVRKDGTVLWVRETARAILGPKNRPNLLVACEDITRRKQGEEKLRQSEAYLHESQRLGHMGSWAYNVSSGALIGSPELLRIFGRDPDQEKLIVEMFRGSVHPEDRAYVDETIDKAMREKTDFAFDHRIVLPGGSIKHVYSMAHRVFDDSGILVEYIGTVMDVTERKRAEEALRQAQSDLAHVNRVTLMGELTASLAHEVNQPIAAAVTNANTCLRWLRREHPDLEEAREATTRIVKDLTRAAEIISRVRLLFKKGMPQRELVDVNHVIREMIVLLRSETMRHNIAVRTELAVDLPQVLADRVQLQQVLMNLIMNSIDATKNVDGEREVAVKSQRAENAHLLLSVSDTGVGLPPEEAGQIFNAFFTTKPEGTGMGLSISRSIVESHGGRLWAAGNTPRGARFYISLPSKVEEQELP